MKFNHYRCERCGGVTVSREFDEGVTPFLLGCRATSGCIGMAQSSFYRGSQDPTQRAHVEFWRPATLEEAKASVEKEPRKHRRWLLEHYEKGGALMREVMEGVTTH